VAHGGVLFDPLCPGGAAVSVKALILVLVVVVIVVGATGGEASAAAIGNAVGEAAHLVRVAWDAMMGNRG
jgi:precorrin isomerase